MIEHDAGRSASGVVLYARSLIETSVNPLISTNPQGKITDVNAAAEEATGIPRDQLIGADFADCFKEPEEARAAFKRVIEEGLLSEYPLALRHVSGRLTPVEYNATVYRDDSGELKAVFAAGRDTAEAQEARRQVARLTLISAFSQYAVFSRDLAGVITEWNAAAEALYGYTAQEAIGRNGAILTPPGRKGETQEVIKRMLRGDRGFGFETQRLHKDGRLIDVAFTLTPIRNAAGDITALSITDHDISRRVRAERALHESEEKFSAAFRASPNLMAITRLSDGTFLEVNEGFTEVLGYALAEIIGKTSTELAIRADSWGRDSLVASLEGGQVGQLETTLRSKDGTLVTGLESAGTFELHGETCVLSVFYDLSERKRAEKTLRGSEAHLRTLIDTLPDLVWLKDPEGVYLSCNRRFESLCGAAVKDIIGKTDYDFSDTDQADSFRHHDAAALAAACATVNEEEIVFQDDGHHKVLETIRMSVRASDGRLIGVLGVGRDITERKRAEDEVRHHAEQLQRTVEGAVQAMSRMVDSRDPYTSGHERRVGELATAIGAQMGMAGAQLDALRIAGTIHDIGKIAVPAEIPSKPGRLSKIEFELIKAHPTTGFEILGDVDFGSPVAEMVRQHHERLDGSGYPQGLTGENILPEARILAVADVVEAMASHRPYRHALPLEDALAEIEAGAGIRYDAGVCEAAIRLFREQGFAFSEERWAV